MAQLNSNTVLGEPGAGSARPLPCSSARSALGCWKRRVARSKVILETRGQCRRRASTALDSQAAGDSSLRSGSFGGRAGAAFATAAAWSRKTTPTASCVARSMVQM